MANLNIVARRLLDMRNRGFTLTEILVVIAIIIVLVALLFPVFTAAKRSAMEESCGSRLRQMAVAFRLYRTDYDDRGYMYVTANNIGNSYPYNYFKSMASYFGSGDILWCTLPDTGGISSYSFHNTRTWPDSIKGDPNNTTVHRSYLLEQGTVVAYCGNHTSDRIDPRYSNLSTLRVGTYLFAREDTSASHAKNSQMEFWWCGRPGCFADPLIGTKTTLRFPGEPWPLTPE